MEVRIKSSLYSKTLQKVGIERTHLNIIEAIDDKPRDFLLNLSIIYIMNTCIYIFFFLMGYFKILSIALCDIQ